MTAAIVTFPGSNRERDMVLALTKAFGKAPQIVWHRDTELPSCDLIVVPGGFSYGDYLRSGAMAAHSPIMREVARAAERGVHVLGVCNGFQVLTEAHLLPGALMRNAGIKFICKDVHLRVERTDTPFTQYYQRGQIIRTPVAHNDGNYFADAETLAKIEGDGLVAFRYCAADGTVGPEYNLNGSINQIAGVFSEKRNVLGLMPHPEDAIDAHLGSTDGAAMFESLATVLAKAAA